MPQPLTDAINALTTYANTVTGASDTTLSDAVATLASGYGGGGGDDYLALSLSNQLVNYTNTTTTNIPESAFLGRNNMESIEFTQLLVIGKTAFANCTKLATIKVPLCYEIGQNALQSCKLATGRFPSVRKVNYGAFMNCGSLTALDLSEAGSSPNAYIANQAFSGCSQLNVLILRSGSVWSLQNTGAFNNSPFASGKAGGTLYVPSALKSSYQSASNWVTILGYATNSIQAIEGSYYETHYADGTPIE